MKRLFSIVWILLSAIAVFAQNSADKCIENGDEANPLVVAVYNFIPDAAAKGANLRELLKAPASFVETLEADRTLRVLDSRTPVLLWDTTLELPEIGERFAPVPAESGARVYFAGKISKTGDGFLLTIDLKNAKTGALVSEQKFPFNDDAQAEQTGRAAANAFRPALAAQKLVARSQRDANANTAIRPIISLYLDKQRVKPNETAKVKITLTDCDGKPLGNRKIETTVSTDFNPPISKTTAPTTDALGSLSDTASASRPTVLRYTVVYRYKDLNGNEQAVSDSQPLIVGSVKGYWLLYVKFEYNLNVYNKILDEPTPWNLYGRSRDITSGSLNIILKAETDEYGTTGRADGVISYDGFIFRSIKGDTTIAESGIVERNSTQSLNTEAEGIEMFEAGFQIDTENKTFSGGIASLPLKGFRHQQQITCFGPGACGNKTFDGVQESDIAHELGGIACEAALTPAMMSSGVFECALRESEDLTNKTKSQSTLGNKSLKIQVALRSLEDTYLEIKKKK
ncbi:MAG: hypothetical protein ABWZ66_08950 [Pyrinomonadaceae bacterium]